MDSVSSVAHDKTFLSTAHKTSLLGCGVLGISQKTLRNTSDSPWSFNNSQLNPLQSASRHSTTFSATHTRRIKESDISPSTRGLLKSIMRSSKLTYAQQRHLDSLVSDRGSLPSYPSNSMHSRGGVASPPRLNFGMEVASDRERRTVARAAELSEWMSKPGIRTLTQIKQSGMYKQESFRTTPMKDMSVQKEVFQDRLEGIDRPKDSLAKQSRRQAGGANMPAPNQFVCLDSEPIDEFDMIQGEIHERRQWIDDMIALGRGDQYKRQIQSEIAQRIARLERIHKEKAKSSGL
ncbi:hypothetical protein BATDEDRAFT_88566 [Batrachochytrium dendrobatidis JAM81]|uniref:Uncharacterized protein n=2 Tax=Batrachochytrium dendrobatidis TaxID=109871 RepID=F4P317_BATDJ|nr:uncharacterized protein BATDEDRAFT_88566 [Batrachochytrium dendrobatidis JAM81]EGF80402.1 hypothetical protein BATDEDRAFT_88566 [Batrachochytrium dendrobatidis JAM81]KAK5666666.1 hypothetical protein QVD99_006729 [Batrachochytrium dendrobatidis]OAJ41192.1 hypothetical protein BDEG_24829 [Batrachochytrium dendrobatidis JEL423]|eukprot:XP_006679273.1 hypothetical protein BATDEDRAFT_88566 [Batrachochytrium dendrobatidis JAM81]